jgi:hypothetical protein
MAQVHHRAPVIVAQEAFDFWLDCGKVDEKTAAALIAPAPEGSMAVYEISNAVNRVANDSPELLEPYSAEAAAAAQAQAAAGRAPAQSEPNTTPKPRRVKDTGQGSLF